MKYYSEITKKLYDTDVELKAAEKDAAAEKEQKTKALEEQRKKVALLNEQRSTRAKEVEDAFKVAKEAYKQANDLLTSFVKDYGSYHYSIHEPLSATRFTDLFDWLF